MRYLARRLVKAWVRFWHIVEGPELEPRICHSHFLSAYVARSSLGSMCSGLQGAVLDIGAGTGLGGRFLDPDTTCYIPTDLPTGRDSSDADISRSGQRPKIFCSGYALPIRDASIN